MTPSVAFLAPDDVGLRGVADDDHRLDPRRQRDKARGNGDAHPRSISGADPSCLAHRGQRASNAAHHVRSFDGNFTDKRFSHGIKDGCGIGLRQAEIGVGEDR